MIDSIHQSMIGTALKCGERFRRRYLEREFAPAGVEAARGQGVHAASKVNFCQKIVSGIDLPLQDLKDAARDSFIQQLQDGVFLPKEDVPFKESILNSALKETLRMTEHYRRHIAPEIQPVATEEPFRVDVGLPVPLAGTMDIEGPDWIDDLKTASRRWPEGKEKAEIQGALYAYAFHKVKKVRPRFSYRVIVSQKGKIEGQTLSFTPTDEDYRAMLMTVTRFWKMVEAGVFLPAPAGAWWCSPRWCQYYETCPFVGNGTRTNWI